MTLLVPNVGEVKLLTDLLSNGNNWSLGLYKTDVTPAETDVLGSYTAADFTDYAAKTLTRSVSGGTWATPSTTGGVTSSSYAQQTWTCGASGNTVYGYYVFESTTLLFAEKFAAARTLASGDQLKLTPQLALD